MSASEGSDGDARANIIRLLKNVTAKDAREPLAYVNDFVDLIAAERTKLIEAIMGEMPKKQELPDKNEWLRKYWTIRGGNAALDDVTAILERHKTKPEPPAQQEGTK